MPEWNYVFQAVAALFAGGAAASGWTVSVIVANTAFDGLDHGRADRHLRKVISSTAGFQAGLLGIATGFALIADAKAAGVTAAIAGLGFLSNVWTLAPRKDKAIPGARKRTSTARVVAVMLTLTVTLVATTAGVLAAFGI